MKNPEKIIAGLFGIIPLGIGLTVLGFLWLTPFNQFGSPPLFFRIFGSFVALGFVLFGLLPIIGVTQFSRQLKKQFDQSLQDKPSWEHHPPTGLGYQCSHCGAPLGDEGEVSPHGDVKCTHCGKWFNIHR